MSNHLFGAVRTAASEPSAVFNDDNKNTDGPMVMFERTGRLAQVLVELGAQPVTVWGCS